MTSYLAPTYFPISYFATVAGSGTVAGSRDRDYFQKLMSLVEATGEFAKVSLLCPGDALDVADFNPIVGVLPRGWLETEDGLAEELIRTVQYQVLILVRDLDGMTRYDWSDRLACLVQNQVDGVSLGGTGVAALSTLRRGGLRDGQSSDSLVLVLEGEFAYTLDRAVGRATDP